MQVDTSGGPPRVDRRPDHRRARAGSRTFVTAVMGVTLGLGAIGCSTSPDASAPSAGSSVVDAAPQTSGSDDAALPIGTLDQRPVLELLPPGAADGVTVLADSSGLMNYRVGPPADRQPAILSARAQQSPSGGWEVMPVIAPGADGIELFNEQARQCHAQGPDCPTGQLALVVDGTVISAPRIAPDQATFVPFTADEITISGGLTEADARALVVALGGS